MSDQDLKLGEYLKDRRLSLDLGLREFCEKAGVDPSNYSKYERGVGAAPKHDVLKRIARALNIKGDEWRRLNALAAAHRWEADMRSDARLMELMPAFYQHLREHQLPDGEDPIDALARLLRKVV